MFPPEECMALKTMKNERTHCLQLPISDYRRTFRKYCVRFLSPQFCSITHWLGKNNKNVLYNILGVKAKVQNPVLAVSQSLCGHY